MSATRLTQEQVITELARLDDGWEQEGETITRVVELADFSAAFGFMARVALAAEKLDHHPDWSNSWNRVEIAVTNHAAGGLTDRCFELARRIDAVGP